MHNRIECCYSADVINAAGIEHFHILNFLLL